MVDLKSGKVGCKGERDYRSTDENISNNFYLKENLEEKRPKKIPNQHFC